MVRKSERNKAQGTPEKLIPERTRKSTRQSSRRKKKSSSESEAEPDVLVDKNIKEVGELSESKLQTEPEGPEAKQDGARTRRSTRRHPDALQSDKEQDSEHNSEWKEDPSFWQSEGPVPPEASSEPKVAEDNTTWKIQSSNGSGGEIQKLKICRQRVTESDSSPSSTKDASPRRKRSTRSTRNLDVSTESTESGGDVPNEKREGNTSSQDIVIPDLENDEVKIDDVPNKDDSSLKIPLETKPDLMADNMQDTNLENDNSSSKDDNSSNKEDTSLSSSLCNHSVLVDVKSNSTLEETMTEPSVNNQVKPEGENSQSIQDVSQEQSEINKDTESSIKTCQEEEQISVAENPTAETQSSEDATKPNEETVSNIAEKNEENSTLINEENSTLIDEENSTLINEENSTLINEEKSTLIIEENITVINEENDTLIHEESNISINEDTTLIHEEGNTSIIEQSDTSINKESETSIIEESSTLINEEVNSGPQLEELEERKSCSTSDKLEDRKVDKTASAVTTVKVPVSNETSTEDILKKLNDRAARFSRELSENKDNNKRKLDETVNIGGSKSPREEGELTPVLETKKSKHTTIVINRPKEISSQPTKLKRNTDDLPTTTERKRRLISKPKPKDTEEDPINISSQSLMLLVPEVKTITPEQVASFPLDDEDLSKFEMERPSETSSKKKVNLKTKDVVEVRIQNDTRQVTKKKHIVIETTNDIDEMKAVGPKLPLQESNRVVRKISLLTEDVKKEPRSPSPSGKAATEVLFITNLVRPFTVPQLRELLARTGTIAPNGFYIDKIKSKCYVKYTDVEMAVETRHALNGVRWPVNNPKTLKVDFAAAEDMSIVQKLAEEEIVPKKPEAAEPVTAAGWLSEQAALKPQRRVTTAVREWDMGKVGTNATEEKKNVEEWQPKQAEPQEVKRRAPSPIEAAAYEPPARKIKKRDNDAPARLLDDLFRKTKATPCIYWLPLTAAQIAVKEEMRRQHMAEHERRLAELRKSDHTRREKDREKSRDSRRKK